MALNHEPCLAPPIIDCLCTQVILTLTRLLPGWRAPLFPSTLTAHLLPLSRTPPQRGGLSRWGRPWSRIRQVLLDLLLDLVQNLELILVNEIHRSPAQKENRIHMFQETALQQKRTITWCNYDQKFHPSVNPIIWRGFVNKILDFIHGLNSDVRGCLSTNQKLEIHPRTYLQCPGLLLTN